MHPSTDSLYGMNKPSSVERHRASAGQLKPLSQLLDVARLGHLVFQHLGAYRDTCMRGEMPELDKAKVFMSGGSQAVRIPARFRFSGSEVYIRRDPKSGDIILSQSPGSLREICDALHRLSIPEDFLSSNERAKAQKPQARPELM